MKQKYKELHNEQEVSNWHYGEKEMFRKENPIRRYLPLSFSFLYWLSSGYGEDYKRAGGILVALLFIFLVLLGYAELVPRSEGNPEHFSYAFMGLRNITLHELNFDQFLALCSTLWKYVTYQKDFAFVPMTKLGEFIKMLSQILIPLQTALFAFAIRNRFRR